jgi:hypothetical protein
MTLYRIVNRPDIEAVCRRFRRRLNGLYHAAMKKIKELRHKKEKNHMTKSGLSRKRTGVRQVSVVCFPRFREEPCAIEEKKSFVPRAKLRNLEGVW